MSRRQRRITRREFVGGALAAAGVVAGAPALLRGRNLNDKLNIAFIACGGRANASLNELTITPGRAAAAAAAAASRPAPHPDENVVVLCDVNQNALDAAAAAVPEGEDVQRLPEASSTRPNDFDAVVVSTAEHTHAFATYLALTHGKHVYCEKPLTYNIWEARLIRETAAKYPKLSTQMGNQGHASPARRTIKEILNDRRHRSGARSARLGRSRVGTPGCGVRREVRQAARVLQRHPDRRPVQGGDADPGRPTTSICGSDRRRRGRSTRPTFPGPRWYRWWDFGNGTMSDLGSHDNDVPYTVLDIKQPLTIEATSPNGPRAQGARARDDDGRSTSSRRRRRARRR